jgi:hypothetical protein
MIYLPYVLLVVAAMAFGQAHRLRPRLRELLTALVVVLAIFAVVGNATVTNRLYATSATTYSFDRSLAFDIGQEKDRLLSGLQSASVPVVINGLHSWPAGAFTEVHETFGISFFGQNQDRAIQFLKLHGVVVSEPTEQQVKAAQPEFAAMPSYPYEGWMKLDNGVLLVNFGSAN